MNKGFTLIEIIVAISVIVVGVVGIYGLVPFLVERVSVNQDRFIASQLAREGLEIVRNIRESNWLEQFSDTDNEWNEGLTGCGSGFGGCKMDYAILTQQDPFPNGYAGDYLKIDDSTGFYLYSSDPNDTQTDFQRKITIDPSTNDQLKVKIEVFYGAGKVFTLGETVYNWR